MKNILLMRHAHAQMGRNIADFERELSERGIEQAEFIGNELSKKSIVVDKIISSSAKRALQTAEIVAKNCNYKNSIESKKYLYLAEKDALFEEIQKIPDNFDNVLLIGHNPGISELAFFLLAESEHVSMPTATIISLSLKIKNWKNLQAYENIINYKMLYNVQE